MNNLFETRYLLDINKKAKCVLVGDLRGNIYIVDISVLDDSKICSTFLCPIAVNEPRFIIKNANKTRNAIVFTYRYPIEDKIHYKDVRIHFDYKTHVWHRLTDHWTVVSEIVGSKWKLILDDFEASKQIES